VKALSEKERQRMLKKIAALVLLALLIVGATAVAKPRVYYYVAPLMGHPYIYDQHLGFKYAAMKFNCEIVRLGPDGWDTVAAAQALEQAIAKKPDGIVVCLWDPSMIPGIKKARAAGIPVIDVEAYIPGAEINTYIGLDNYQCGVDTAKELIARAGKKGNMVMQGNWGASNTEAKLAGFMDYLQKNSEWKVVTKVDDKANTETSIEGAKSAFNNFKNLQGYVGIDSSSAPGIGAAMEELGIKPGSLTVITHDREDATLEYIAKGYIQASLINKTAMQAYLAIGLFEMWYNNGFDAAPVSANNKASGFEIMPQFMYTGAVVINKDNVNYFMHNKMDKYATKLYH
jgi:ribose transport system substrate-binding protein